MSEQNSPARETLSPSTSGMDSGTFYSINDSDIVNMNLSGEMDKSLIQTEADKTLTNLSQSTLSFILDERQNASNNKSPAKSSTPLVPIEKIPPSEPVAVPTAVSAPVKVSPPPVATPNDIAPKPTVPTAPQATAAVQLPSANVDAKTNGTNISTVDSVAPSNNEPSKDASSISIIDISDTLLDETAISIGSSSEDADDESTELSNEKDAEDSLEFDNDRVDNIKMYNSIEEFERNLPHTVTVLDEPNGGKVFLVGTAHFSRESQDDVSLVIRNVRPDIVMVELCSSRIHILKHDEKTLLDEAKDINISKIRSIIKTHGLINGVFYIVLLNMSAKLTKDLGMAPGGEFRRALEEVHRLDNTILHLGDRPINVTLQRALSGLSYWQTIKIVWKLIWSDEKISKEDVEQCKQAGLLEELMQQMAGEYPVFRDVFVTERDLYLCHSLQVAAMPRQTHPAEPPGPLRPVNVVGVVGIGHCAGIAAHWGKVDLDRIFEISTVPETSRKSKVIRFAVKWAILGTIGYGVFRVVRPRLPTQLW